MSQDKSPSKKKVVVTTSRNEGVATKDKKKRKIKPTVSRTKVKSSKSLASQEPLIFGKKNYILMVAGFLLMVIGFVAMSGGSMPSPDVWDESIIYSSRRTVLAPILILGGLIVEIVAIFK